jgi:hypothetical protein
MEVARLTYDCRTTIGNLHEWRSGASATLASVTAAGVFTGNGSGLTTLNGSNISSGTVATARLGSGTADSTTFLRGDSTWTSVSAAISIGSGITSGTSGSVLFVDGSGTLAQSNSTFFWDATNSRLALGTNSASARLQVNAAASGIGLIVKANATTPGNIQEWQNSSSTVLNYIGPTGKTFWGGSDLGATHNFLSGVGTVTGAFQHSGTVNGDNVLFVTHSSSVTGSVTIGKFQGTTTGNAYLQVSQASTGDATLQMSSFSTGDCRVSFDLNGGGTNWSIGLDNSDSDKFKFSTGDILGTNDKLTLDTSGNAVLSGTLTVNSGGVNVATFSSVSTTDSRINLTNTSTGGRNWNLLTGGQTPTGGLSLSTGYFSIADGTGGFHRLVIDTSGNVGLNKNSSLGAKLHVVTNSSSAIGVIVQATASQSVSLQEWWNDSGTALASISSAGLGSFAGLSLTDATNIAVGTSTGTKIGTATTQKLAFWNVTPIVQPANTVELVTLLTNVGLRASGGNPDLNIGTGTLTCGAANISGLTTISDAQNIAVGTSTGTKIGTSTSQKLGFFNATPIVQPANTVEVLTLLGNLGLRATGGNPDLNIGTGAVTSGSITVPYRVSPVQSNTDGSTITFDLNASDYHTVTIAASRTLALSNAATGKKFTLRIKQDGTGGWTLTWFSGITWFTSDGNPPTIASGANKVTVVTFMTTGSGTYDGFLTGVQA